MYHKYVNKDLLEEYEVNFNVCYITIEESSGFNYLDGVTDELCKQYNNEVLELVEDYDSYFVLKVYYEEKEDIIDISSVITSLLLSCNIYRFTVTINYEEYF